MAREFRVGDRVRWRTAKDSPPGSGMALSGEVEGLYVGRRGIRMLSVKLKGWGGRRMSILADAASMVLELEQEGASDEPGAV